MLTFEEVSAGVHSPDDAKIGWQRLKEAWEELNEALHKVPCKDIPEGITYKLLWQESKRLESLQEQYGTWLMRFIFQ